MKKEMLRPRIYDPVLTMRIRRENLKQKRQMKKSVSIEETCRNLIEEVFILRKQVAKFSESNQEQNRNDETVG